MRLFPITFACLASLTAVACGPAPIDGAPMSGDEPAGAGDDATVLPPDPQTTLGEPVDEEDPATESRTFAEVVYVLMRDRLTSTWYCTGTLVAKDRVVTAAHCLDPDKFVAYKIIAPRVAGSPKVSAHDPRVYGGTFEDVANPDIGYLTLDRPISLPVYATLTDVVSQVESGADVEGAAVVRTAEEPFAPLTETEPMPITSTVDLGYEHGFGVPLFSKGGDSGAGMFLVENGRMTHKLIGVVRQPEPDRGIDHLTRVDAGFIDFYEAGSAE